VLAGAHPPAPLFRSGPWWGSSDDRFICDRSPHYRVTFLHQGIVDHQFAAAAGKLQ